MVVLRVDGGRPVLLTSLAETSISLARGCRGSAARWQDQCLGVIAAAVLAVGLQEEQGAGGRHCSGLR